MLRGIVIGTGWAGEGYVTALRQAEVEIVALCGRSPEPTRAMGARLGVADVRLDWRAAIDDLLPDIVVVATPAEPHREMVEYAAERGAHVVCEKPLGLSADDGRRMLAAVEAAGDEPWHGGDIEAHRVKRPGSGGGSGYWISTRGWSVRFVA